MFNKFIYSPITSFENDKAINYESRFDVVHRSPVLTSGGFGDSPKLKSL